MAHTTHSDVVAEWPGDISCPQPALAIRARTRRMKLFFEHQPGEKLLANATPESVLITAEGLRLRLALEAGEELAEAVLELRRDATAVPPFPAPTVETSAGAGVAGVSWVKADWGSSRTVRSFALGFGGAVAGTVLVRVQIATGGSGWFSPPGPHTFTSGVAAGTTLDGTFPDTVADRIMFEFLNQTTGQPADATLASPPLAIGFGAHARDLSLRLAGGRDFFTHAGELATGATRAVPDLLATLRDASSAARADVDMPVEIVLDVRAAVTGFVALTWSFAARRIVRRFADDGDTRRLALPWKEPVREALPLEPPGRPETLTVALTSEPVPERLVLEPALAELGEAVAALCRPLADNAQPFALALAQPLAGVDLWARPLTTKVTARIDVRADEGGRPAALPNRALAGTLAIDSTNGQASLGRGPSWWPVTFDAPGPPPVASPGGRFWVCVQIDEGELLWFLSAQPPAAAENPRYRRDQGDWLPRQASVGAPGARIWALARLRAVNTELPPPPGAEIILVDGNGSELPPYPLVAGPDGLRWDAAGLQPPVPGTIERIDLRLTATVASTVTLSSLHLGYRPAGGG
jgi:hypothetical protein